MQTTPDSCGLCGVNEVTEGPKEATPELNDHLSRAGGIQAASSVGPVLQIFRSGAHSGHALTLLAFTLSKTGLPLLEQTLREGGLDLIVSLLEKGKSNKGFEDILQTEVMLQVLIEKVPICACVGLEECDPMSARFANVLRSLRDDCRSEEVGVQASTLLEKWFPRLDITPC